MMLNDREIAALVALAKWSQGSLDVERIGIGEFRNRLGVTIEPQDNRWASEYTVTENGCIRTIAGTHVGSTRATTYNPKLVV